MRRAFLFLIFIACSSYLFADEDLNSPDNIVLDLLHPRYQDGVLTTEEGGVLRNEDFRVQAKKITYTRKLDTEPPIFTLYAEGDLLIDYQDNAFVGDSIFFDFLSREGCIRNGKTAVSPWFVGGEKIVLCKNGDIIVENGYITSSEGGENDVMLTASNIVITRDKVLTARSIHFKIKDVPVFYFPYISLDVSDGPESPISFTAGWGGFLGTYLSMRYHFLTWRNWDLYLRLDAFTGRGLGGGLETEYESITRIESLYTRSYFVHDISIDDPKERDRYRFQGTYDYASCDGSAWVNAIYDVASDDQMANDFPPYDFDLGTAGKTELTIHDQDDFWMANVYTKVRVNSFQTINQDLPTIEMGIHPFEIGNTGIVAENLLRASYLSYVFSKHVHDSHNISSFRFEVYPRLYRPFTLGPIKATPEAAFVGIAYSDSPEKEAVGQALGDFNVLANTEFSRCFGSLKHIVEPYIHYHLYTHPRVHVDRYYVFTIDDGYSHLNLMRFGLRNSFAIYPLYSHLFVDLWANAFFDTHTVPQSIPKGYATINYKVNPYIYIGSDNAWNFAHGQLDFSNVRGDWTISENLALGLEYRHRGRFDWRKADFYNFVLESSRTEEELLHSPLSERRDIALARIFCRLNPNWDARFQVRHGWNRIKQPSFTEYRLELGKVIFQHYRLLFSYEKRVADHRFTIGFKLDPFPPKTFNLPAFAL